MSQQLRCETCKHGGEVRNANNRIVCKKFDDEHESYDKCKFWVDITKQIKKRKR